MMKDSWPKQGVRVGSWDVLPEQNRLTNGEHEIFLTPKAMDVFVALLEAEGRTLGKEELMERVWGREAVSDESLHAAISKIRRALASESDLAELVVTVPRKGYRIAHKLTPPDITDKASPQPDSTNTS